MSENIKQVLVVRTDLKMRRGKEDSQCGHAALAFIGRRIQDYLKAVAFIANSFPDEMQVPIVLNKWERDWFLDIYTKITLAADSEEELWAVRDLCEQAGLPVQVIIDAGLTEIPPNTPTCIAIGPAPAEKIDAITGREGIHPLKLR